MCSIKTIIVCKENPAAKALRDDKDLLRFGILHFATGRVTADVDVTSICFEWIENQARPARNRLSCRKLRGR